MMKRSVVLCSLAAIISAASIASADVLQGGATRLVAEQNADGGWDWPLSDGYPKFSNASNILAPAGMGLLQACQASADPNVYLPALTQAGGYLLMKAPSWITPDDGYFAVALDARLQVTTHTDWVKKNFYDALAAGTYAVTFPSTIGVWHMDAADYVATVRWMRQRTELPNLAALDCGIGLYSAGLVGADKAPWIAGTEAEINELDGGDVGDVLGLAGALLGLASVGEEFDPTEGEHAAAKSVADLADILAGYQLASGGFTWNGLNLTENAGNESVQETAIAILALNELDYARYAGVIDKAAAYLESVVLPTGGWENFLNEGENNEVTGESLWAIAVAKQAKIQAQTQQQP